jgi:hypothetical protein
MQTASVKLSGERGAFPQQPSTLATTLTLAAMSLG